MTNLNPAPPAAVQIVREALAVRGYLTKIGAVEAPRVVAALARAGWLHDPAEVQRLREDGVLLGQQNAILMRAGAQLEGEHRQLEERLAEAERTIGRMREAQCGCLGGLGAHLSH